MWSLWQVRKGSLFRQKLVISCSNLMPLYRLVQPITDMTTKDWKAIMLKMWRTLGFAIPNAILGFTGKAFNKVTFNLSLNPAKSGGALLQQAWFDIAIKESFRIRAGKFKTPFMHAYLSTLGETLFPVLPYSATRSILLPYDLNYVIPSMSTGFDLGVMVHGLVNNKWEYQVGIFNGTGIDVNTATKTNCDDHEWLPSLLYSGRLAFMPKGEMPNSQGSPENLNDDKMSIAVSASYNAEARIFVRQRYPCTDWNLPGSKTAGILLRKVTS